MGADKNSCWGISSLGFKYLTVAQKRRITFRITNGMESDRRHTISELAQETGLENTTELYIL